ncbi:MAG: hypothetical protein WD097_02525 [Balneolales bacterium]
MEKNLKDNNRQAADLHGVTFVSTKEEREQFIDFPYHHYEDDPVWIPPLKVQQRELINTKKNPFFKDAEMALFLGWYNGKVAGRIAAIVNHAYNRHNKTQAGFFGFFECIENQFITDLLFRVARDWLRERNCTKLLGPMNPGLLDEIGIQIEGFEHSPAIMMPHSKKWYDQLIRKAGLKKAIDLLAYKVTHKTIQLDRMNRAVDIVMKRTPDLSIRKMNFRKLNREVDIIHKIFNKAWAKNWGFYEIDKEIFFHLAKELKQVIDTDFAHIAMVRDKPVAFSIALPDYNQVLKEMNGTLFPTGFLKLLWYKHKINGVRTALMGVIPEYQGRGIDALLTHEAISNGIKRGFNSAELGWLLETNIDVIRVAERVGGYREKTYRMYEQEMN